MVVFFLFVFFHELYFLIIFSLSLEVVARALAGKRHRCQGAESPRLDHEENPRLQWGVPQTQVVIDSAHFFPPAIKCSVLSALFDCLCCGEAKVSVFRSCHISHQLSVPVKPSVGLRPFVCLSSLPSLAHLPFGLHPRIFSHPNVLPVLGACLSPAPHPVIITHWMPYGSLYNVLHEGTSEYFHSAPRNSCCTSFFVVVFLSDFCVAPHVAVLFQNSMIAVISTHFKVKFWVCFHVSWIQTDFVPCNEVSNLKLQHFSACTLCIETQPSYHKNHLFTRLCFHVIRLCCGPDASGQVCSGHCMWNGLPTHTWTYDPSPLSQQ